MFVIEIAIVFTLTLVFEFAIAFEFVFASLRGGDGARMGMLYGTGATLGS